MCCSLPYHPSQPPMTTEPVRESQPAKGLKKKKVKWKNASGPTHVTSQQNLEPALRGLVQRAK